MDLLTRGENGILNDKPKIHQPKPDQPPENDDVVELTEVSEVKENGVLSDDEKDFSKRYAGEEITKSVENYLKSHNHGGEEKKRVNDGDSRRNDVVVFGMVQQPHSLLPKPEAPPGVANDSSHDLPRSQSMPETYDFDIPAIGKFFLEKSNSLSAAITKRISSLKENNKVPEPTMDSPEKTLMMATNYVTEFKLSGFKVIVNLKPAIEQEKKLIGRISFFSRSNCRDCTAVRSFLRAKNLNFVEINIDVFPEREKELKEKTGNATVPQIFFNDKLFGGLAALNSMRNSGILGKKMEEMLTGNCPPGAPEPPVYGFDDPEEEEEQPDEMVKIVRVLRQRLPIQDRLMKMKIVKNCFSGRELVEVLMHQLDCGRREAVEIGKQLARKHFIHHVFGENEFEDGNHFYRFLEHEPFIPKCYNLRGATNDCEPKDAAILGQRLMRIMSAILEAYASEDRSHLDYLSISKSEEFRRYVNLVQDLQRVNILALSAEEKLAFFLNLYNAMAIHAVVRIGHPGGMIDRRSYFSDFLYVVGGYPYSLAAIRNGILRSNRRAPFSIVKPFSGGDKCLELALPKVNQLSHFGLCHGTRSSPA